MEKFDIRREIEVERSPEEFEHVQFAAEREMEMRSLSRESALLRKVQSALDRIADRTFGLCTHCEDDIHPKRLDAVPWTPFCIRCQESVEGNLLPAHCSFSL